MWKLNWIAVLVLPSLLAQSPKYGVGRAPTAEEESSMNLTVLADGTGLPAGSGTASKGKDLYSRRCTKCHGAEGQGREEGGPIAGGVGTLNTPKPLKTVGSYWPHATTLFDYIRRAMPFDRPGTLNNDQVYELTAHVLFLNKLIGENDVIDAKTLAKVKMPNRDGFVKDPRPKVK